MQWSKIHNTRNEEHAARPRLQLNISPVLSDVERRGHTPACLSYMPARAKNAPSLICPAYEPHARVAGLYAPSTHKVQIKIFSPQIPEQCMAYVYIHYQKCPHNDKVHHNPQLARQARALTRCVFALHHDCRLPRASFLGAYWRSTACPGLEHCVPPRTRAEGQRSRPLRGRLCAPAVCIRLCPNPHCAQHGARGRIHAVLGLHHDHPLLHPHWVARVGPVAQRGHASCAGGVVQLSGEV